MFNEAIAEVLKTVGDDTLVIVTSDHAHSLNINGNPQSRNDILGKLNDRKIECYILGGVPC